MLPRFKHTTRSASNHHVRLTSQSDPALVLHAVFPAMHEQVLRACQFGLGIKLRPQSPFAELISS